VRAFSCERGPGGTPQEGTLLVQRALRDKVRFLQVNLNAPLPHLGTFDIVFLRNVLIYFDKPTQEAVASRLTGHLRPGGFLILGHSESLIGSSLKLRQWAPAVFQQE